MSAELEVIEEEEYYEAEVVEETELEVFELLNKRQATALDKKVRATSDKVTTNVNALVGLLEEAMNGQIHEALEFPSWTAWVKDAVQIQVDDRLERKSLVALMSGKGMSQRAIAGTLGVSQKTVDRDLEEVESESAEVTGLDNKSYSKTKKKATKVVDPAEPKPGPISEEYRDEIYNLRNAIAALKDLIYNDERFPKARNRIAKLKITDEMRLVADEIYELLGVINGEEELEDEEG